MGDSLNLILTFVAAGTSFGGLTAGFWASRNATLNKINKAIIDASKERIGQLETENGEVKTENVHLKSTNEALVNLKTPDITPVMKLITNNHKEVMKVLGGKKA